MKTSFRQSLTVLREGTGSYVAGRFVPASPVTQTISATVQPASVSDAEQIQPLPGGQAITALIRIYTDAVLGIGNASGQRGDCVLYTTAGDTAPRRYRIIARQSWDAGMRVDHHRYLASLEP
ncbi:hypothetical protein [Granulibacter bethesdensis]|uniref:Uncharacterized protein n=2 Tax=Granulibacter bethesdensis TaxID=364410 RepID=Q0BRS8_GRABC|nr:hypothetical protein [Granulibacter bethesdensis]ABI62474.1 Hypothetical protein GbCGDNIH1_1576 [Granulibacter bethesdensis CGDNIH1]AHJ63463.1 Hypothetical protein GbCGDNIH3_1576 [Granulibacter bethesdensis]AHJ68584.1 Hypothetical protein GbCGDNIH2_1576 [Granulibacter bethesdensis]APH52315.1 Hypothetical protein GbCGDNIH5_1576 [Granulibacter bethesdensis]APH59919.1 Hypothetical protein GbCGDNIH7_1576 [Granulibacter bethesdensis]